MKPLTISAKEVLRMNRQARRNVAIQENLPTCNHKVHKSKKDYNRKADKNKLKYIW